MLPIVYGMLYCQLDSQSLDLFSHGSKRHECGIGIRCGKSSNNAAVCFTGKWTLQYVSLENENCATRRIPLEAGEARRAVTRDSFSNIQDPLTA